MTAPTYAGAVAAAKRIQRYFSSYPLPGDSEPGQMGERPSADVMAQMIDAAFWTSLRREEVYTPRVSLAYIAPEQAPKALRFASPLPLLPQILTKMAAAVERAGIHAGVWANGDGLSVWGVTRALLPFCLVVEVVGPGFLVVKQSPQEESGKFINIAVLQGDEIKIVDSAAATGPDYPALLAALLRMGSQFASGSAVNVMLQLAVSARAHGRGGILLVVPAGSENWRESVLQPLTYAVTPPFAGLADLLRKEADGKPGRRWEEALRKAVDGIAGLTAVDGATLITADYELLAFGAKIVRRKGSPQMSQVVFSEPVEGGEPALMDPEQLGGTRHLSAAQFVHDQHEAIALVASQDGRFTVFAWSESEKMVHAHRIDALLL